jgi:hypothetical protein
MMLEIAAIYDRIADWDEVSEETLKEIRQCEPPKGPRDNGQRRRLMIMSVSVSMSGGSCWG